MEHINQLDRIEIILVEPQDGANIGASCRAMQTMGISNITIIGNKVYDEDRIKTLAVHALPIWEHHKRFDTLEEAIQDSVLVVGASRRRGKKRKYFALLPEQLAQRISNTGNGKVSIVFGREADGLRENELNLCHMGVNIPSVDSSIGSLNLSQAVQVITYSLYRNIHNLTGFEQIKQERIVEVSTTMSNTLESIGYYKNEKEDIKRFFTDIIARATLSESEAAKIEKMFRKIEKIKIYKDV